MNEEKQIEEMADIISDIDDNGYAYDSDGYEITGYANSTKIAEALCNAGYRKQEWISVEDRLPEENGRYLACVNVSHLAFTSLTVIAIMDYGKEHGFYLYSEDEPVTHWMPLPEAPKMKGGAE